MGNIVAGGVFPLEGSVFPYGFHNAIPNFLRPYVYYYPKTNIPLPHFGMDWGNYPIYPLGMKTIPNRLFTSKNRQMYRAIIDSNFKEMERLIDSDFDFIKESVIPESGLTALGMAASLNLLEVVDYLTKRGVDFETKIGPYKKTALHIAIENGHEMTAKYLLNNGADINYKDVFGLDVYDKAEFRGYYHFKKFLDHFKNNPKKRLNIDYEEFKYTREVILEDIDTFHFLPSDLLEITYGNKLNPVTQSEKINLDKFEIFMFNRFNLDNLEKYNSLNLMNKYDSLRYFNNLNILS
jgi:ankyrin repeat protein